MVTVNGRQVSHQVEERQRDVNNEDFDDHENHFRSNFEIRRALPGKGVLWEPDNS